MDINIPTSPVSRQAVDAMIGRALDRVARAMPDFTGGFPAPSSKAGRYPAIGNIEWTNGFWTGMLWLAFELSGESPFRDAALAHLPSYVERIEKKIVVDHHDLGFLYTLACTSAWQIEKSEVARSAALGAAKLLYARFDPVANVIQAWGDMRDPGQRGRMIIDCNLNLPLLWWASAEIGDPRFARAAELHVGQAARLLVRPDYSTYHTFYVDTETGLPRFGSTHQGFSDESCWARGQAWGIYGFALAFRHTGSEAYLDLAAKLADYFLARQPSDGVCCWDLIFTAETDQRDSSAAAIAACGLLEIGAFLPVSDARCETYLRAAVQILQSLDEHYLAPVDGSNGLLAHGVYHWPNRVGVDECCIWGDYFYLEALMRLAHAWRPYWA